MDLHKLTKADRALGIIALAAADPGALGLSPELVDLPDQATVAVMLALAYGIFFGDRKLTAEAKVQASVEVTGTRMARAVFDPVKAAEVIERCRRANIDPQVVADAVAGNGQQPE